MSILLYKGGARLVKLRWLFKWLYVGLVLAMYLVLLIHVVLAILNREWGLAEFSGVLFLFACGAIPLSVWVAFRWGSKPEFQSKRGIRTGGSSETACVCFKPEKDSVWSLHFTPSKDLGKNLAGLKSKAFLLAWQSECLTLRDLGCKKLIANTIEPPIFLQRLGFRIKAVPLDPFRVFGCFSQTYLVHLGQHGFLMGTRIFLKRIKRGTYSWPRHYELDLS